MADQLATPQDLASALQLDYAGLDATQQATMELLVEIGTSVVQEAAGGQQIVQVVDDPLTILGTSDSWLDLPQIPVTAVSAVTIDGEAIDSTDYTLVGNRLFRRCGWQRHLGQYWGPWYGAQGFGFGVGFAEYGWPNNRVPEPSIITLTYTHGYAAGAQQLQLARSAVLTLAAKMYTNPADIISESIDDYTAAYGSKSAAAGSVLDASPYLKAAIRRQYGRRATMTRIG